MSIATSYQFGTDMVNALGLPPRCTSININMSADNPLITVNAEFFPTEDEMEKLIHIIHLYDLKNQGWDLVKFCKTGNGYL
jgi:hypothetical protein